jgi:translocation and assembly module TamB
MQLTKRIQWVLIGITVVILLLLVTGIVVAHAPAFQRFLLARLIQSAEQSTGARVEVNRLDIRWLPLSADLSGIVVHGPESNAEPPLLQADRLRVGLKIRPLLHHQVDFYELAVDHPVMNIRVDPRGNSNIPHSASKSSNNFSLIVQHMSVRNGLIDYNNQQIPLSAELESVGAEAAFDAATGLYRGSFGYNKGQVLSGDLNPFVHKVHVVFTAGPDSLALNPLVLSTAESQVTAHAEISNFAQPNVQGDYNAILSPAELANIVKSTAVPSGEVALNGRLSYRNEPDQPFLQSVQLEGLLESQAVGLRLNQIFTEVRAIHAAYQLQAGNFRVQKLDADLFGGHLTAAAEMLHLADRPFSKVTAHVRNVSLRSINEALPADARQNVRLVGSANLDAQASWSGSIQDITAHTHLDIQSPRQSPPKPGEVPVNGLLDASYDGKSKSVFFRSSQLRTGSTELSLNGLLSSQSNLNVSLTSADLHQLTALASTVVAANATSKAGNPAKVYDLHGSAQFVGQVSGALSDPQIKGQLAASNLEVQGSKWRTVRANIDASPSGVRLQNGYLESEQQGQLSFDGQAGLQHWSLSSTSPLSLHAKLTKLSVTELERLGKLTYAVSGELSGELWVNGSPLRPAGQGSIHLTHGSAWSEPINSLKLDFQGNKESVQSTAVLRIPAGNINAKLNYVPESQNLEANVNTAGLDLNRMQSLRERAGSVSGILTANIVAQGKLKDPQLNADIEAPSLQVSGQTFSNFKAQLNLVHQHADFSVDSVAAEGFVQAKGGVTLTGNYPANARLDVRALPLGPLLAKYLTKESKELHGLLEVHGSLNGPLKDPARLEANVDIPTFNLGYKTLQIANDGPLRMKYSGGSVTIEQAKLQGTGSNLTMQGVIPIKSAVPMNVSANGTIDVALLQIVAPDAQASGRVDINLTATGHAGNPTTKGQIRIVNTSLSTESLPITLSGVNGQILVSGNRIDLTELTGSASGGTLSSHGYFILGKEPTYSVDLQANSVRLLAGGVRTSLNGKIVLSGTPQQSLLNGQVVVDSLSFRQGFDLGTFVGQLAGEQGVSTPSPFLDNMKLNISVLSSQNLNLASSQLSIQGSANLNVTGTASNPVILGRIALTGGEVFFLSKRFEIQSGTIAFANPVRTEPVVNLYVNTTVQQYKIAINFQGPVDRLKTTYTSEPSLPPLEIINLLAFGRTASESAADASTPTSLGAQSVLAQGVAGEVAKGVQSLTGISQLTIDPLAGGTNNPGAQVSVQQRVTGNLLLTFSTNVTSTQSQAVQLQYQPKRQVSISVLRDEYGGYGIDVRLHKAF